MGFSFLDKEQGPNFRWVLQCVKKVIDEVHYPRVIVTDRDLALMGACDVEFPNAKKLLCRWHISNNMLKHCRQRFKTVKEWDSVKYTWEHMIKAPTEAGFEHYYEKLKELLVGHREVSEYLNNWLENYRHMFVSVLTDQYLSYDPHSQQTSQFVPPVADPSRRSYSKPTKVTDLNQEPARHSSYVRQMTQSNNLIDYIPEIFRRHIFRINNVEGDGNCGLRSVAVGIDLRENMWPAIRQNLLQALDNYEILFTEMWLSDGLRCGINGCVCQTQDRPQSKRPIVIALVGGIYYINLTLYESSPIPPNHPQWRWYASGNAPEWEDIYSNRHRVC
ncbi:FAR1-related sequence 5-like protein [Tanacetum coccineum]